MFHSSFYPFGAIGPLEFLWQPVNDDDVIVDLDEASTKLWLTVSPAVHDEVMEELTVAAEKFGHGCRGDQSENAEVGVVDGEVSLGSKVAVTSLRDEFVRFRLIGPRSHAVVMETLKPIINEPSTSETADTPSLTSGADLSQIPVPIPWWNEDHALPAHTELLGNRLGMLRNASGPEEFPRGTVVGMMVLDPRLFTPNKKTDMVSGFYPRRKVDWWKEGEGERKGEGEGEQENEEERSSNELKLALGDSPQIETESAAAYTHDGSVGVASEKLPLPNMAYSPLWSARVREVVSQSKIPDHILNDLRSQSLVSTAELLLGDRSPRIPVMLVRQEYSSRVDGVLQLGGDTHCHGYQTTGVPKSVVTSSVGGWDLLLPSNWGMAFWVSLIYRGARACGGVGLRKCCLETGTPSFPEDHPDTGAGLKGAEQRGREEEREYRQRPPNKRCNFGKLSIQNPFFSPWGELVKERENSCFLSEQDSEENVGVASEPPAKRPRVANGDSDIINKADAPAMGAEHGKDFYVLRSKLALLSLSHFLDHIGRARPGSHSGTKSPPREPTTPSFDILVRDFEIDKLLEEHPSALVGITFEMLHRGNATNNDIISVPTVSDLQNLTDSLKNFHGPEETLHSRGLTVVEGDVICVGVSGLSRQKMAEVKRERKRREKALEKESGPKPTRDEGMQ